MPFLSYQCIDNLIICFISMDEMQQRLKAVYLLITASCNNLDRNTLFSLNIISTWLWPHTLEIFKMKCDRRLFHIWHHCWFQQQTDSKIVIFLAKISNGSKSASWSNFIGEKPSLHFINFIEHNEKTFRSVMPNFHKQFIFIKNTLLYTLNPFAQKANQENICLTLLKLSIYPCCLYPWHPPCAKPRCGCLAHHWLL